MPNFGNGRFQHTSFGSGSLNKTPEFLDTCASLEAREYR
jgi:hypothetical protein